MQSNDLELEATPNILETPSLATPNFISAVVYNKNDFDPNSNDYSNELDNSNVSLSSSIVSTTTLSNDNNEMGPPDTVADEKLSRIEDELRQSVAGTRKPTPSPFEKIVGQSIQIPRISYPTPNDDGIVTEAPSTADVVLALESLTNIPSSKIQIKSITKEIREASQLPITMDISDSARLDGPMGTNTGANSSPKKIFLLRSQSINESSGTTSTNSNNNNTLSNNSTSSFARRTNNDIQSVNVSNGFDTEDLLVDSMENQLESGQTLTTLTELNDASIGNAHTFKSTLDDSMETTFVEQIPNDINGGHHHESTTKQQPIVINTNKRSYAQINSTSPSTKIASMNIPTFSSANEVSSSDQLQQNKRQKANLIGSSFRSNINSTNPTTIVVASAQNSNANSDDQRRKQIRDSNREAARRCRERRRQYIEQLEGNLEQAKHQIKQLDDKINRLERENLHLRTLISESKLAHSGARLASNDQRVELFVTSATIDLNSDATHTTDNGNLQRTYINRNSL